MHPFAGIITMKKVDTRLTFYNTIGLDDLVEKLPERVLPLGELVGGLTEKAAEDMGLIPGIPVGEGGADAFVGVSGLNAHQPGQADINYRIFPFACCPV